MSQCKDWNERRSSLKKQLHSKEFADGKCLTKSWVNDDLSDLKEKLRQREEEGASGLSHIYSLDQSVDSMDSIIETKTEV